MLWLGSITQDVVYWFLDGLFVFLFFAGALSVSSIESTLQLALFKMLLSNGIWPFQLFAFDGLLP